MPTTSSKHFYTHKDSTKRTLKRVIRPTYKRDDDEMDDDELAVVKQTSRSKLAAADHSDAEIMEINRLISQATERLKQIEVEKLEAARQEEAELEDDEQEMEFNGADEVEEQLLLVNAELTKTRRENRKLQQRIEELEEELKHQEAKLTKAIASVSKEVAREEAPPPKPPIFSFSQELSEALKAIDTLSSDTDLGELEKKNSLTPTSLEEPELADKVVVSAPVVAPQQTNQEAPSLPAEHTPPPSQPPIAKPESDKKDKPKKPHLQLSLSPKKKREKKLLVTATILLATLSLSSLGVYLVTKPAGVDDKLVAEYLENSSTKVLGEYDQLGVNKDGIVADKDADEPYEASKWSEYRDTFIGVKVDYPASVVERLHSTSTITFMRKDSYLMKVMQVPWNDSLEAYWEQNKNAGVAYLSESTEFKTYPALKLTAAEPMEYPTNRLLVKVGTKMFDILYAAESDKFSEDDFKRVATMLESIRFIQ